LTHRNTKRKIRVVGPFVAADSESNLHHFRFVVAPSDASAGNVVAARHTSAVKPWGIGNRHVPAGLRHRRCAPGPA
jgi:hypothetical protein